MKAKIDLLKKTDQLLIGCQKPHKPVSTNTIARWIKNAMAKAGIDTSVHKAQHKSSCHISCKGEIGPY